MKSAWFWGTEMWERYQQDYYAGKVRPEEYKSSPLENEPYSYQLMHNLSMTLEEAGEFKNEEHQTQVIDLRTHQWSDIRKSYHAIIHKADDMYDICSYEDGMEIYQKLHAAANGGQPRTDTTYWHQQHWIKDGHGLLVLATDWPPCYAAAYWIIWQGCAYYMSGPSVRKNVQHAVIWKSFELLRKRGVTLIEMGQIDGATNKEQSIGLFKRGWGGSAMPFTVVKRISDGQ